MLPDKLVKAGIIVLIFSDWLKYPCPLSGFSRKFRAFLYFTFSSPSYRVGLLILSLSNREQRYMSRHINVSQYQGFFDILMYIWCISTRLCFRFPDGVVLVTQIWVGKNSQCFHEVSLGPIVIRWFKTKGRVRLSYTYLVIVQLYQGSGDHLEPTWTPKLTMQG